MERRSGGTNKMNDFFHMIKSGSCLRSSSSSSSTTDTGKGKFKRNKIAYGFHLVEGKAGHDMEDYHVAESKVVNNRELGLFAIFDGHLGDNVARYLRANLFNNILKEPNFWNDPMTSIKNAYHQTDKVILDNSRDLGPGGSTAVTAIVIEGQVLLVANVGDSRGVLCEDGKAVQLTIDHEPYSERKRIEKHGGFVTNLPGDVPRVNGQLAVARAFGDHNLKAHLSSEPDLKQVHISPSMEFAILASDGLWKVIQNQEAVDIARPVKDPQAAAKRLTNEALNRNSKDDISCIVIQFRN